MKKEIEAKQGCPVDYAFKRIGGKHKGKILWSLAQHEILRYGELGRIMNETTSKMLTQTLRELEQDDLINRKVYLEVPPKVEYSLSKTGAKLIPFIKCLGDWGNEQLKKETLNKKKK